MEAPKDVRRLEALKPVNIPSMGERYEAAASREKRLEAATLPTTVNSEGAEGRKKETISTENTKNPKHKRKSLGEVESDSDSDLEKEQAEQQAKPQKKKKKKKAKVINEADLKNVEALEEEDEVEEGVVWSDTD